MNTTAVRICAGLATAAAIGLGAAPAGADTGLPLEESQQSAPANAPIFVPQTGSAGEYNSFMCYMNTFSADFPCAYT